jgi:hypothetical protein
MELVVDLGRGVTSLADAEDTDRFSIVVQGEPPGGLDPLHRLSDVLENTHVGRLTGTGEAFVRPEAVSFRAAGQVAGDWPERFAAMCEAAVGAGWTDPADGALRAHVVWPDNEAAAVIDG